MKQEIIIIQIKRQFSFKAITLACMALCCPSAFAVGFGEVSLRSNLGDVLRVQVPLTGASEDSLIPSCIKSKIETLDGELIDIPRVEFVLPGQTSRPVYLNLISRKPMAEPAVKFSIAMTCGTVLRREYTVLLDYADSPNAASVPLNMAVPQNDQTNAAAQKPDSKPVGVSFPKRPRPAPELIQTAETETPKAKKEPTKHPKQKEAAGKDVLQVVNADSAADLDLKMSPVLSDATASNADVQRSEENRQVQAQFAAILRGEDPLLAARNEVRAERQKNKNLQSELQKMKLQDALKEQGNKGASPLLIGLIAVATALFLALLGLVIFAVRRARSKENQTWWDASQEQKNNVVDIVDFLQTTAEKGNLDPNPIATVSDTPGIESPAKTETPQSPFNQEDPVPKFKRSGLPSLEDTNSSTFNFYGNRGQSIHIEEISDITQEAEFWMSVNDPHRAIEILEPQSRDENPATPVTWLYLLDLYRLVGDENNYRDLRQRFKRKFNAKIPNFHEEIVPGSVRSFEDFPQLVANCCKLWQTDDIVDYLESLLVDDREGDRVGFDLPVYRDILFLLAICAELKRTRYHPLLNKDEVKITGKTAVAAPPLSSPPPPVQDHLDVKPEDMDNGDYSHSLNFDALDFKSVGKGSAA